MMENKVVGKRILITGAAGLVGKQLLETLSNEYQIHALVRSKPSFCQDNVSYYECDLACDLMQAGLPKEMDAVIHLAQSGNVRNFPSEAMDMFNVNVKATSLLLDYAHQSGAAHFIFASTGGLYGPSTEPYKEDMQVKISEGELAYYFRTKYASENLVQAYADLMSVYILRPFFIYGPKQKKSMLIPRLAENISKGNPISLRGEKGIMMNPVHVHDVVQLIRACLMKQASMTINVAGPSILSLFDMAEIIGKQIGKKPIFTWSEADDSHFIANNETMKNMVNIPLIDFQDGIASLFSKGIE